jgi:hypothetical protein
MVIAESFVLNKTKEIKMKSKLQALVDSGKTYKEIQKELGWTEKKVRYWFKKYNLKTKLSHSETGERPLQHKDLIGKVFGHLTIRNIIRKPKAKGVYTVAVCYCDSCKQENKEIYLSNILSKKHIRSCGCNKDHFENIIGSNNYNWKGFKDIPGEYWSKIKKAAKRRKKEFTITIQYAWDLFEKQNKKCALTGLDLYLGAYHRTKLRPENTASIDRIDSRIGYVRGNIQWVHKDINWMKQHFTQEQFINYCRLVIKRNEK